MGDTRNIARRFEDLKKCGSTGKVLSVHTPEKRSVSDDIVLP